jgi:WD40 repeat protein
MVPGRRGVVRFFDASTGRPAGETQPVVGKDAGCEPGEKRDTGGADRPETTHRLTRNGRWIATTHPSDAGWALILTEVAPDPAAKPRQVRLDSPPGFDKEVQLYEYTCVGGTAVGAGREAAAGRKGPVVFRWDLTTGRLTGTTRIAVAENGFVLSVDGRRLLTEGDVLRVWDTGTGAEAVKLDGTTRVGDGVTFSPDGGRVVGIVHDPADRTPPTAVVWELGGRTVVGRVRLPGRYAYPFLLPDGRTLVAADRNLMVTTWDLTTGRRLIPAAGHENGLRHAAFSADGAILYTASHATHEPVIAWDAGTGKKLRELPAVGGYSRFVFTPGGAIVDASYEGTLVWVDAATGRELRRVEPGPLVGDLGSPIWGLKLAAGQDPRTGRPAVLGLARAEKNQKVIAALWDAASGELLARRPFAGDLDATLSPDGRWLAREVISLPPGVKVADAANCMAVVIEDAATGTGLLRIEQPDCLQGNSLHFTPDGQSVVTWTTLYPRGRNAWAPAGTTTVRLWELRTGKERLAFTLPVIGEHWAYEPRVNAVSADGRWLAGARLDNTIAVWDLATGVEVAKRLGFSVPATCLAFRPDGRALASGHRDGTAVVWDLSGLPAAKAGPADRAAAWADLASADAGKAYRAVLALVADPGCDDFLGDRLKPAAAIPAGEVARLVAALNDPEFATRERATAALVALGEAVDADLRAALGGDLSVEQRKRVREVLARRELTVTDPELLRALRAVEVLGRSGSPAARSVLARLAGGAPGDRLTREAGAAVRRLAPAPGKSD